MKAEDGLEPRSPHPVPMRNKTMRIISTCAAAAALLIASTFGAFAAGASPDTAAAPTTTMPKQKTMHHSKMHHSAAYHKPHRKSAKYYGMKANRKAALQHKTKKAAGSPASTY